MTDRRAGYRTVGVVAALLMVGAAPSLVRADAVDEAFQRGNGAAAESEWASAIEHYEEAVRLHRLPNSGLSYNLGTAYAQLGRLGHATYHLREALEFQGGPTTELVESARYNLGVVRRRAEIQATASGAQIDRPETWWDLVVDALRAPVIAWVSLASGWSFVALLMFRGWRRRRGVERPGTVVGAVLLVLGLLFLVPGALHGSAIRADSTAPQAIVLEDQADARDGPGPHRKIAFVLQGGSRVRIVDRSPGWAHIRLPGGLQGWVVEDEVGQLRR